MSYVGFKKLESKLGKQKGITNPGGLARKIGIEKYGQKAFEAAAKSGHTLKRARRLAKG